MIDIHTHGISGIDTRTSKPEDILRIAEAHGSKGVSAIVAAIYPASIERMRADMEAVKRAMRHQGAGSMTPAKGAVPPLKGAVPPPAWISGVHLEGPFLNPAKCGALDKSSFLEPTEYNLNKLIEGYEDIIRIITISPEVDGALRLVKEISETGISASMGHSDATYAEAEAGYNAGARGITHLFNAMSGFHHREPGLAGFGLMNRDIYVEVIGDPYHLHPETLRLVFNVKSPDRIILISDSIKDAPYTLKPAGGRAFLHGGSMTIAESSERLIGMGISEEAVKRAVTENPKRYLAL